MKDAVTHLLHWLSFGAKDHLEKLGVYVAEGHEDDKDKEKTTWVCQVRALETFKKGSLCFFPSMGILMPVVDTRESRNKIKDATNKASKFLHADMVHSVELTATGSPKVEGIVQTSSVQFKMFNPLSFVTKPTNDDFSEIKVHPCWAMLHQKANDKEHNMIMEMFEFTESGFKLSQKETVKFNFPKTSTFRFKVPMFRNVKTIQKDEVLCLPSRV